LGIRILGSYALTLAGYYYLFSRQESRERLLSESRLQAQLATTTLNALKSQLHPHFLFNAMNAISTLIRTEPRGAERMLNLLANLLRRSLKESKFQVVPLNQEVDFVRSYLEIEQIRFSDRLNVEYDLAPEILDALVPHLILQPLVENAVRHGLAPKAEPGTIRIQARRAGDRLSLSVSDDGVGCQSNGRRPESEGLGLPNTRARLEQLFGECFEMQAGPQTQRGFSVQIFLPLSLEKPTNGGLS
jgi:LytS/YehU family sensor histidine kinase